MTWLVAVQLLLAGLLAGEEFIVRWGVQPALSRLPDDAHVRARIALVKSLKVVVPVLMLPTVAVSVIVVVVGGATVLPIRIAALTCLVVFVLTSFLGTVPINIGVDGWDPAAPPADWRRVVRRWQRLDTLRSTAAVAAFALFVVALVPLIVAA